MTIEENERPNVGNDQWSEYPQGYVIGWSSAGWLILEPTAVAAASGAWAPPVLRSILDDREQLAGWIRRGIGPGTAAATVTWVPRMLQPAQAFFYPTAEQPQGTITRGIVVIVTVTSAPAIVIRAAVLAEPELLRSFVRAGLAGRPPPARWLQAAAAPNGIVELTGKITVGFRVVPPPVVPPFTRATVLPDVEAPAGRIIAATPLAPRGVPPTLRAVQLDLPLELPGKITTGYVVVVTATTVPPAIRIGGQLIEPEVLTGKFAVGFAVQAPPWFQRSPITSRLFQPEILPSHIAQAFRVVAATPAIVIRPAPLPPAEELPGRVTVGYKVNPAPPLPVFVTSVRLPEPETLPGRITTAIVIPRGVPVTIRAAQLELHSQPGGRISTGYVIGTAGQTTPAIVVKATQLVEAETLPGRISLGIVTTVVAPPFNSPAIIIRTTVLPDVEQFTGRIVTGFDNVQYAIPVEPPGTGGGGVRAGRPGQGRIRDRSGRWKRPWTPERVIRIGHNDDEEMVKAIAEADLATELAEIMGARVVYQSPTPIGALPTTDDEIIMLLS